MLHGHSVGIARKFECQQGHVQQTVAETSKLFKSRSAITAKNADGLLGREAVVTSRDRRVRGEDALLTDLGNIGIRRGAQRSAPQFAFKQRLGQKRGMTLIHVIDVYVQAQRMRHACASHAQHDLLFQPIVGVAAV